MCPRSAPRGSLLGTAVVLVLAIAAIALPSRTAASELIARNATAVELEVNAAGRARVSFSSGGNRQAILAWGAIDALHPDAGGRQVAFALSRTHAGGAFRNVCRPYRGPRLGWLVTACTAPDGSHWALQSWQRRLPSYGARPDAGRATWELRLSHWRGPPATLRITLDWSYRRFHHLFGTLTYRGRPVHGFGSAPSGEPLDDYGRNIYLDTFGSAYGPGWRRENGFLAQKPTGGFCYGLYPHGNRPAGTGSHYRATVVGPGVTPDVTWSSEAPGGYNAARDAVLNRQQRSLLGHTPRCRVN